MGWAHADAVSLRATLTQGVDRWDAIVDKAVAAALVNAAPPGGRLTRGAATVGPAQLLCGEDAAAALAEGQGAPRCVLEVRIDGAPPAIEVAGERIDLPFPDGRTEAPGVLVAADQRLVLDATLMSAALGRSAFEDAVALRLTDGSTASFLRLR